MYIYIFMYMYTCTSTLSCTCIINLVMQINCLVSLDCTRLVKLQCLQPDKFNHNHDTCTKVAAEQANSQMYVLNIANGRTDVTRPICPNFICMRSPFKIKVYMYNLEHTSRVFPPPLYLRVPRTRSFHQCESHETFASPMEISSSPTVHGVTLTINILLSYTGLKL